MVPSSVITGDPHVTRLHLVTDYYHVWMLIVMLSDGSYLYPSKYSVDARTTYCTCASGGGKDF